MCTTPARGVIGATHLVHLQQAPAPHAHVLLLRLQVLELEENGGIACNAQPHTLSRGQVR
jgi:hypothetical protein